MKRFFTLIALVGVMVAGVQAQSSCTPDPQFPNSGIYPLPTAGTLQATETMPFSQIFTVNVPADSTLDLTPIVGFPVPPVSVTVNFQEVTGVTGLPTGMTYTCDATGCNWPGNTSGCFEISGTPTQTGQFTISIDGTFNFTPPASIPVIGGQPQSLPVPLVYQLTVDPFVNVDDAVQDRFEVKQNHPNPFQGRTEIDIYAPFVADVSLEVFDLQGKVVLSEAYPDVAQEYTISLDVEGFTPGVYFYRLSNGETTITKKMILNR